MSGLVTPFLAWRARASQRPFFMSNRLTQIATRTGDDGRTGLGDGTRVSKDHLRVQALGDVDELNSTLGVLLAEPLPEDVRELLITIQHERRTDILCCQESLWEYLINQFRREIESRCYHLVCG